MEVLFVGLILVHVAVTLCQADAVRTMLQGEGGSDGSEARESNANQDGLEMARLKKGLSSAESEIAQLKSEMALLKRRSSPVESSESRIEKRKRLISDESKQQNGSTFRAADRFTDIEKKFKSVDKELKELHSQVDKASKEQQKNQKELQSQVNQIQSAATRCEMGNEKLEYHGEGKISMKACSFPASFKRTPKVVTAIHYWATGLFNSLLVGAVDVTKSGFNLGWGFADAVKGTSYSGGTDGVYISWIACASLG